MSVRVTVLSPDEQRLYQMAVRLRDEVIALGAEIQQRFLELGRRLALIQQFGLWETLGYASMDELLSDPDVNGGLHRRHLYRALRVARVYLPTAPDAAPLVAVEDVAAIGITKADLLAPVMAGATMAERAEWLAVARTQSVPMLRRALADDRRVMETPAYREAQVRERLATRLHALADELTGADEPGRVLRTVITVCQAAIERCDACQGWHVATEHITPPHWAALESPTGAGRPRIPARVNSLRVGA